MRTAVRHLTAPAPDRGSRSAPALALAVDPALDDALDRIAQLTARLHAVTDLHVPRRTLLGARVCRACRCTAPCPTERASRGAA